MEKIVYKYDIEFGWNDIVKDINKLGIKYQELNPFEDEYFDYEMVSINNNIICIHMNSIIFSEINRLVVYKNSIYNYSIEFLYDLIMENNIDKYLFDDFLNLKLCYLSILESMCGNRIIIKYEDGKKYDVPDMSNMFKNCHTFTSIDLDKFK